MMQDITIEEIVMLDSERTQGDWKANKFHRQVNVHTALEGGSQLTTTFGDANDAVFVAAAPRIAAKCLELDKVNKELVEALMESVWQMKRMSTILTHHGISGGLFDTDEPIKRAELALKEAEAL